MLEALAHVLAHAPLGREAGLVERAASLYEPRYVAWARDALPREAVQAALLDAAVSGALLAREGAAAVQLAFVLFDDDTRARATADRSLVELARDERERALVRALVAHEAAAELVRAAALLSLDPLERALSGPLDPLAARGRDEVARAWDEVGRELPAARRALEVSLLFGPRGRALGARLVVGGPAPFHDGSGERAAQQALHELGVEAASRVVLASQARSGEAYHVAVERLALAAVDAALAGTTLAAARQAFVGSLDLRALAGAPLGDEPHALDAVVEALRAER